MDGHRRALEDIWELYNELYSLDSKLVPPKYNEPAELGPDEQLESDAEESDTFVDSEGCCGLSWHVPHKVFKPPYGPDVGALIKRKIEAGLVEPTEENDFSEYILQDIKDTLQDDAYFIGFLAAVSKYQSWGQVLHAAFIIFILIFAIACQGSMIWFMRWGQSLQSNSLPAWNDPHIILELFLPKDGDVSSDLSSWILFLGLCIFFMQIVEEEERVHIYLKVLNNSEWLNKKMKHELHCSMLRAALVFCLKCAKAVMPILLRIAGVHTLFCSSRNLELVLNCTALTFVFQLDEIAMKAACPRLTYPLHLMRWKVSLEIPFLLTKIDRFTSWAGVWQTSRVVAISMFVGWLFVFRRDVLLQYSEKLGL
eukprot:s257_g39.t1